MDKRAKRERSWKEGRKKRDELKGTLILGGSCITWHEKFVDSNLTLVECVASVRVSM